MLEYLLPLWLGVSAIVLLRYKLKKRRDKIKLKPNCLLTQYPLLFIYKKKGLIPMPTYSETTQYLIAHGYDLITITTPANALKLNKKILNLKSAYSKAHVLYESPLEDEIQQLHKELPDFFASAHKLEHLMPSDYLKYAISLAEQDFQCSH